MSFIRSTSGLSLGILFNPISPKTQLLKFLRKFFLGIPFKASSGIPPVVPAKILPGAPPKFLLKMLWVSHEVLPGIPRARSGINPENVVFS